MLKVTFFSLLLVAVLLVSFAEVRFVSARLQGPTIPVKLFDVRNGNGVIDGGTTYAQAIVIPFRDAAAKQKLIDAIAAQYAYPATVPDPHDNTKTIANPQTKNVFAMKKITVYLNDVIRAASVQASRKTAEDAANAAIDTELPPGQ